MSEWTNAIDGPRCAYTKEDILMCEFYALDYLSFDLIVFHPYRPLTQYLSELGLSDACLQPALYVSLPSSAAHTIDEWTMIDDEWYGHRAIVNDSYRTDLCLVYPPYMIAITAIYMACTFLDRVRIASTSHTKLRICWCGCCCVWWLINDDRIVLIGSLSYPLIVNKSWLYQWHYWTIMMHCRA